MMKEKTYSLWGYAEDGKYFLEITYQTNAYTQKFIRFEKAEHQAQFIDLLIDLGYEEVT